MVECIVCCIDTFSMISQQLLEIKAEWILKITIQIYYKRSNYIVRFTAKEDKFTTLNDAKRYFVKSFAFFEKQLVARKDNGFDYHVQHIQLYVCSV